MEGIRARKTFTGNHTEHARNEIVYAFTGTVQTFTAPVKGIYQVECYGGSGGNDGSNYGQGGYSRGSVKLNQGQVLYVVVGDYGGSVADKQYKVGWNGGGSPGAYYDGFGWSSGGGGGATDIRTVSAGRGSTNWQTGLYNRIIVAGGGGGGCGCGTAHDSSRHNNGAGFGGGLTAASSCQGFATGGRQNGGGYSPYNPDGGFGYGYGLPNTSSSNNGSGGGGGWYGGTAGTRVHGGSYDEDSGSGGSSYISGYPGCSLNPQFKFTNGYMTVGGNTAANKLGHAHFYLLEIIR